ncbi:MAG: hypothetical protein UV73_C0001G0138 [Candidatus Gottesmanbacteria bacterium GW2011_GWA2_43_14]|uniref:Glycosyltransferase RgtA/B/C/D-like domain-containing protein n=1 Tax=Candidatus Gottesmanbacteria bacterium GW2011_GWA2_43_14 TaxID=1618443 RepID=A0A0G1DM46_9BACT|nr:MAG: hypothetical protein UV73_C0001G0138 [Candidatus Gottesmanbacteria bacterium GW2011_GWA2_43_14]
MNKFLVFILFFLLSLSFRFENLKRDLDFNGYITAHTLLTLKIWEKVGIKQYNFSPVYTFPNENDRHISNLGGIKDIYGNYYYISYPPFAFIFPYFVFQIFKVPSGVLSLYILNLLIHLVASYFVYLTLSVLFPVKEGKLPGKFAFIGFIVYLFISGNLWFHQNLYFVDIFVQVFFVISTYLVMNILFNEKSRTNMYFSLFFIVSFFMAYSEWIGLLFSLSLILIAIFKRKDTIYQKIAVVSGSASFMAVFLTLLQYSRIAGAGEMFSGMWQKYQDRSGLFFSAKPYLNIVYFYYINYLPAFIFIMIALFLIRKKRLISVKLLSKKSGHLLYFSLCPVILHYLVFFNFNSNHSFSVLKTSLFLSVITSLSLIYIMQVFSNGKFMKILYASAICLFISISVVYYYFRYHDATFDTSYKSLGYTIKERVLDNEMVYLCGYPGGFIEPQILYYAERNIKSCSDMDALKEKLIRANKEKAVIFLVDNLRQVKKSVRIPM